MTNAEKPPGSDVFEQAIKNYEQTLRAGLKLQEEAGRWWGNLLNQATSAQDLQKRIVAITNEVIAPAQKRMEEYLKVVEDNNRTSVDLMKKAVEVGQVTNPKESQAKLADFCDVSLNALKANSAAVAQINGKMIDSWIGFVKKNIAEPVQPAAHAA
jgi:hypothetical protein